MDSRLIDSIILGNTDLAEMEFQDAMRDRVAAAFEVRKVELASGLLPSDELNEGMYDFSLDAYNGMPYEVWKMYKDYNVKQGGRIRIHTPDEMEWHGKTAVVRDVSDGLVHVQLDDTGRKLALTPNQLKPITMNEARIPLEGHPYHDKTNEQLRYIIKDAGEAAKAMKDVNPADESRYLDQMNNASTVLGYRERIAGRAVTEALSPKTNAAYNDYEYEERYRASDICPNCDGEGHHGIEPDSGNLYTCYGCGGTGKYMVASYKNPTKDTQVSEAYSKDAVNKAIASSNRSGRKIGGKEAKAIHRLLSGRTSPETPTKPSKVQKESMDKVGKEDKDIDNDGDHDKTDKYLHNRRKAIGRAIAKKKMNEAEQIDEISDTTRRSWINKTFPKHFTHSTPEGIREPSEGPMSAARKKVYDKAVDKSDKIAMKKYEDEKRQKREAREPQVHDLRHLSHGEAYDETQTNSKIKDGDVLRVEGGTAAMVGAWPTMIHGKSDTLHSFKNGVSIHDIEGGSYHKTGKLADKVHGLKEEQMDEIAPIIAGLALRAAPMLTRAAPTIAGAAERKAVATAAEKGMGSTSQKIIGSLVRRGTSGAVKKTASAIERKASQSQQQNEMAPSGAKYERMVKHIKAKYAKGGLTDRERAIAYATAWKAKRAAEDE